MHFLKPLWLLLSLTTSSLSADTSKFPKSITLSYTLLGPSPSTPKQLAQVLYNPETLKHHLSSWTPPSTDSLKSTSPEPANSPLVQVSLPDGSSSVTTLSAFDPCLSQYIDLWFSPSTDAIFSASISSISPPPLTEEQIRQKRKEERARAKGKPLPSPSSKPKTSKKGKKVQEEEQDVGPVVKVCLLRQNEGPQPKLNSKKPPQVDAEGREVQQEDVPEKSFFQKYWWVFLVGTLLIMGQGGGEK